MAVSVCESPGLIQRVWAQSAAAARSPKSPAQEDSVQIEFTLDVHGHSVVARSRGAICAGTISGKLGVILPGGSRQQLDVSAATAKVQCMNCLPTGRKGETCPCEETFLDQVELVRYSFPLDGDYVLLTKDLTLSCAPRNTTFHDAQVVARSGETFCKGSVDPRIWDAMHTPRPAVIPDPSTNKALAPVQNQGPVPQNRLEIQLLEYGTARRLPNVPVVLEEVQSCPPNRHGGCTPAKPHRLTSRTADDGVARFVLPARRTDSVAEPLGLHYHVQRFSIPGFAGSYPLSFPVPVPGRRRHLVVVEPGDATRPHRLTYLLVPHAALRARTESEAKALAEKNQPEELQRFLSESHAKIVSVAQDGLLWKIQWVGDGQNPSNNQRCYYLDSIEGILFSSGMQSCK